MIGRPRRRGAPTCTSPTSGGRSPGCRRPCGRHADSSTGRRCSGPGPPPRRSPPSNPTAAPPAPTSPRCRATSVPPATGASPRTSTGSHASSASTAAAARRVSACDRRTSGSSSPSPSPPDRPSAQRCRCRVSARLGHRRLACRETLHSWAPVAGDRRGGSGRRAADDPLGRSHRRGHGRTRRGGTARHGGVGDVHGREGARGPADPPRRDRTDVDADHGEPGARAGGDRPLDRGQGCAGGRGRVPPSTRRAHGSGRSVTSSDSRGRTCGGRISRTLCPTGVRRRSTAWRAAPTRVPSTSSVRAHTAPVAGGGPSRRTRPGDDRGAERIAGAPRLPRPGRRRRRRLPEWAGPRRQTQEVFGWTEVPRIADGRVPVVLHLLSPARRPLAVTSDLASFWEGAYPHVRAENRGRYPKHPWPEDPISAPAMRGTKRSGTMER